MYISPEERQTPNEPRKSRTKNWVEINQDLCGTHRIGSQIKFKTSMLKSSMCNYSDAYRLVSETISVAKTAAEGADANNRKKKVLPKICASFTDSISERKKHTSR